MQAPVTGALCAMIARSRRIHVGDVLALRHSLLGSRRPSHHDATSIAGLAAQNFPPASNGASSSSRRFRLLIDRAAPRGELTEENAAWLIARFEAALTRRSRSNSLRPSCSGPRTAHRRSCATCSSG